VIVVDASVLANMLLYVDDRGRKVRAVLGRDTEWAAPEHWKAELFSVIRGLALGGKITETQAVRAVDRLPHLGVDHVSLTICSRACGNCTPESAATTPPTSH
jgi:predicted nucleic acid-binding protein